MSVIRTNDTEPGAPIAKCDTVPIKQLERPGFRLAAGAKCDTVPDVYGVRRMPDR